MMEARHRVVALRGHGMKEAMSIFLVRHADAGNRAAWQADERLRPLTQKGLQQAVDLAERLRSYHPRRLLSSPHVRCVQTLEPLAAAVGVAVEETIDLAEGNTQRPADLFRALLDTESGGLVLCSHGDVVATLLSLLSDEYEISLGPAPPAKKGSIWHISVDAGRPVVATYLPPSSDP